MSLKAAWFQILLALAKGEAHGAEIRRKTQQRTGGEVQLYPTMLYGSLYDLTDKGWITELDDPDNRPPDANPRQRFYRITALGLETLAEETHRMQALVEKRHSSSGAQPPVKVDGQVDDLSARSELPLDVIAALEGGV